MTKWIYSYINCALEEINIGPFENKTKCKEAMRKHESFGALCMGPIAVDEDYELYQGD